VLIELVLFSHKKLLEGEGPFKLEIKNLKVLLSRQTTEFIFIL